MAKKPFRCSMCGKLIRERNKTGQCIPCHDKVKQKNRKRTTKLKSQRRTGETKDKTQASVFNDVRHSK